MKTKTKIIIAIGTVLIWWTLSILIQNWEMLNATYDLFVIESKLSYNITQQEKASFKLNHYNLKVKNLHSLRAETDNRRRDIATIYLNSQEAIDWQYIIIN